MMKIISSLIGIVVVMITGCGSETPKPTKVDFSCHQEGVQAPEWTCVPMIDGSYAGIGIAQKSVAGIGHMRKIALANGRSDLAQQIELQVKDKVETFTRTTGIGMNESVDKVTTSVSKQVAKVNLRGSKAVASWQAPSGTLYLLVTISEKSVNKSIKKVVTTSFKNDQALWQQFQSKNALESLDKEFPTN